MKPWSSQFLAHQDVEDAVGEGEVGPRGDLDVEVGVVAGRRASRRDVDDPHARVLALVLEDAAEEHRVHLGHVVAPEHEVVSGLEVRLSNRIGDFISSSVS